MKWTKKKVMMVVGVILLIGGSTVAIFKGVEHYRSEQALEEKREEAEMRHNVALWVVQNLEGKEPITDIKVGPVETAGIGGTGGYSVGVKINNKKRNEMSIQMENYETPAGGCAYDSDSDYTVANKPNKSMNLENVTVEVWEEN